MGGLTEKFRSVALQDRGLLLALEIIDRRRAKQIAPTVIVEDPYLVRIGVATHVDRRWARDD
jgi:hypothetical protein